MNHFLSTTKDVLHYLKTGKQPWQSKQGPQQGDAEEGAVGFRLGPTFLFFFLRTIACRNGLVLGTWFVRYQLRDVAEAANRSFRRQSNRARLNFFFLLLCEICIVLLIIQVSLLKSCCPQSVGSSADHCAFLTDTGEVWTVGSNNCGQVLISPLYFLFLIMSWLITSYIFLCG